MILDKFIAKYKNPNVQHFNLGLINREQDRDLKDHLIDVFKSLDVIEYIKYVSHEYIDDARQIDMRVYSIHDRDKTIRKEDGEEEKTIRLRESKVGEIRVKFLLTCNEESKIVEKRFLIPLVDDYGYYTLNGKRFFLIYQLVDSSTYARGQSVVLKSILPIYVNRIKTEIKDLNGNIYNVNKFTIIAFNKNMDLLYFYFAKYGVLFTLLYFGVNQVIRIVKSYDPNDEENLYFPVRANMLIRVNKRFFEEYEYVQNFMGSMLAIIKNRTTHEDLENLNYWIERIGALRAGAKVYNYYTKGKDTQLSIDRMVDIGTMNILKVAGVNKSDTYSVLRWLVQNFDALRKKDDMDLNNKRLRCNEFIAGFLTAEFTNRVNQKIIKSRKRVTMKRVESLLSMSGDIVINKLHKSGLFRSNEAVDDIDFFTKLSYTTKGPNALGNSNGNSMAVKYRGIHTSYLGNIDILSCGSSDPGASGTLTPFADVENLNFNNSKESQDGVLDFLKDLETHQKLLEDGKWLAFTSMGGEVNPDQYLANREKMYADVYTQ